MKTSRGLALIVAIPALAACGSSAKTAQIAISSSYSVAPTSSSHSSTPTSSKPASSSTVKTPSSAAAPTSQHVNVAPAVTPAPVQTPVHRTTTPAVVAPAPAVTHHATQQAPVATHSAPTRVAPTRTAVAQTPKASTHVVTPVKSKAPVVVAPTKTGTTTPKTPFTAALVTPVSKGQASPSKYLTNGTWRVYVTGINATSVTVSVLGKATGHCTDDCLVPISTQTIPLASINIPTVMPVKSGVAGSPFQGVTAPAWVYTQIFNQGQIGLNNAIADGHYAASPAIKAKIDPKFSTAAGGALGGGVKSVYSDITIQNGVATNLSWTYHP